MTFSPFSEGGALDNAKDALGKAQDVGGDLMGSAQDGAGNLLDDAQAAQEAQGLGGAIRNKAEDFFGPDVMQNLDGLKDNLGEGLGNAVEWAKPKLSEMSSNIDEWTSSVADRAPATLSDLGDMGREAYDKVTGHDGPDQGHSL